MVPKNLTYNQLEQRRKVYADVFAMILGEWWKAEQIHRWRWKLWFHYYPENNVEHAMEISRLTPPQESAAVKIKSQDNTNLFLLTTKGHCIPLVRLSTTGSISQVLECLRQWAYCVMPELFLDKWMLYHDNTPSNTVLSIVEVLVKGNQFWFWNTQLNHQILVFKTSSSFLPLRIMSRY